MHFSKLIHSADGILLEFRRSTPLKRFTRLPPVAYSPTYTLTVEQAQACLFDAKIWRSVYWNKARGAVTKNPAQMRHLEKLAWKKQEIVIAMQKGIRATTLIPA